MSQLLPTGSKARQRKDKIDRALPFSNTLRLYGVPTTDVDFIVTNGANNIRLLIEVTCPDEVVYSADNYLAAIDQRRRDKSRGNHNDDITLVIAQMLGARAILAVFEPDVYEGDDGTEYLTLGANIWWRWVDGNMWHHRIANDFFQSLRSYALPNQ